MGEIIYMTPLYNWNPYGLVYKGDNARDIKPSPSTYNSVTAGGRDGGFTRDKAYNGIRRNVFYQTPAAFFQGNEDSDPADTSKGIVGVLDPNGNVCNVTASGTRILLPEIPGVGRIRTRYPISPLHNDGSQIYKELEALKDVVTRMETFNRFLIEYPTDFIDDDPNKLIKFEMTMSTRDPPGLHTHVVEMYRSDMDEHMASGDLFEIESSESNGHSHVMQVQYKQRRDYPWRIMKCGPSKTNCWDGHERYLVQVN